MLERMIGDALQGMEASKLHVAQLENTIKELQEGAEKATRTAESAAVGTEQRITMVHDEPAETASRADATVSGLQNGQGMSRRTLVVVQADSLDWSTAISDIV
jgi:hypothetical protein